LITRAASKEVFLSLFPSSIFIPGPFYFLPSISPRPIVSTLRFCFLPFLEILFYFCFLTFFIIFYDFAAQLPLISSCSQLPSLLFISFPTERIALRGLFGDLFFLNSTPLCHPFSLFFAPPPNHWFGIPLDFPLILSPISPLLTLFVMFNFFFPFPPFFLLSSFFITLSFSTFHPNQFVFVGTRLVVRRFCF